MTLPRATEFLFCSEHNMSTWSLQEQDDSRK